MERINFQLIEKKWQTIFEKKKLYRSEKDKKFKPYRGYDPTAK